ncbi:hypothetical protein ACFO5R_17745 [Halosolutus amylolyticus]|uniref:DUF998 domain-containing protein n=1 Tax=Halosolutus amylolyticus TaxID=2932267 RepID=A0ABD5PTZ3_9EURY|nr:hypothetical protein [Halosolutus amylolyticus]
MPTTADTATRSTPNTSARIRAGGIWLAIGSVLLVVGFALHPPPAPDPAEFVATIADAPTRWVTAHAVTAIGLSAFAIGGLIVLTTGSRLTRTWWVTTAWAVLIVSALLVTTAAVVEATVITDAAIAGETTTFETWSAFAEAHSAVFLAFLLAIAVIAGNEARSGPRTTPTWASWIGAVAAIAAFAGMVLVFGVGIALGGLVWIGATIVMGLWTAWFGIGLARSEADDWTASEEPRTGSPEPVH